MDRREAIRRTGLLMGGLVFAPSAMGVLQGCRARPGVDWNPEFFDQSQARLVTNLSDVIIPTTDTPGAVEAGVPAFIEEIVSTVYGEEERQLFVTGLEAFNDIAREEHGSDYVDLDPDTQFAFADEQNTDAIQGDAAGESGTPFFLVMKELTMLGYFTSEIGATQTLQHVKVPGRYDSCAPLDEIGRTWAVS